MAAKDIWAGAVDGAFTGGKWGMRVGAIAGIVAGLGAPPAVIVNYIGLMFGTAVVYGAMAAVGGIAIGAAIGAVIGASKAAMNSTAPHPKDHAISAQQEEAIEAQRGRGMEKEVPLRNRYPAPATDTGVEQAAAAQNHQDRLTQARNIRMSQNIR